MNHNQPIKLFIKDHERSSKWHRFYTLRLPSDDGVDNVVEIERIFSHETKEWNTKITPISGQLPTLFKACYDTRLTYKVVGLSNNQIKIINTLFANDHNNLSYILDKIKQWNGSVTYHCLNSDMYKENLKLIDYSMDVMLGYALIYSCKDSENSLLEISQKISNDNPVNCEPYFYQYKFKRYLVAINLGFNINKEWFGHHETSYGFSVNELVGQPIYHQVDEPIVFEDILLDNTKISVTGCVNNQDQLIYSKDGESYLDLNMNIKITNIDTTNILLTQLNQYQHNISIN